MKESSKQESNVEHISWKTISQILIHLVNDSIVNVWANDNP